MKQVASIIVLCILFVGVSSTTAQDRLQIVASHSILGDVISNIVGDVADVAVTMPRGADPHGFEPVPSDLTALARADVVFINGAFFEEGLLEAIENAGADMNIVSASTCIEFISFDDDADHSEEEHHDDEDHDEEEHHEDDDENPLCSALYDELSYDHHHDALHASDCDVSHEDEDEAGTDEDEHEHGACDPHVWMNPENVMLWTLFIRDRLIELDPANADTYTANADAYVIQLRDLLDNLIVPMIDQIPAENRVLVTSHDSLGYFAERFDFEIVSTIIPGGGTAAEPSTANVVAVIDRVRDTGVSVIFGETTVSDNIAQTIASETGAELRVLYSGSLSTENEPASTYLDYMTYNITTITDALS